MLGRTSDALARSRRARRLFRALGNTVGLAKLDVNLGNLHHRQDRPARAVVSYRRALDVFRAQGLRAETAFVGFTLANVLTLLDVDGEAERLYVESERELTALGRPAQAAHASYNLAYLHFLQGRYNEAVDGFARAESGFERLEDEARVALCRLDRSEIRLELGLEAEAERDAALALAAFGRLDMRYEEAKARTFLALARLRAGHVLGAAAELARAQRAFRAVGNVAWAAVVDLERAELACARGERSRALRLAVPTARALALARLPMRTARALELEGRLELDRARPGTAARLFRAGLGHARRSGARLIEARLRIGLGRAGLAQAHPGRALRELDRAVTLLESLHAEAPAGEWEGALAREREAAFREAIDLTLERGMAGDPGALTRCFLLAERARARSLVDRLAATRPSTSAAAPSATGGRGALDARTRLLQEVAWRRRSIETSGPKPGLEAARARRLSLRLARLEREARALDARIDHEGGAFAAHRDVVLSDPGQAIAALPPDAVLIEYVVGRESVHALVLDRTGLRARRLAATRSAVAAGLRALTFQMNAIALGPEYVKRHHGALTRATLSRLDDLGELLLGGLEADLGARRLVVAPHDLLHHVPFHALHRGGHPLLEEHEVSVVPSASALRLAARSPASHAGGALVLGVPSPATPAVEREAGEVAALLEGSRLVCGEGATRARFAAGARGCRVVHVSTHGSGDITGERSAAVRLADGWLGAEDISALETEAELVVLSACHAGVARLLSADENTGLAYALLRAGARAVVTTLWPVEDEVMAVWMKGFYQGLRRGVGAGAALQLGSLAARERDPHPYAWAPCMLAGWAGERSPLGPLRPAVPLPPGKAPGPD